MKVSTKQGYKPP